MHTLFALVLTAAAAIVVARPPGPVGTTVPHEELAQLSPSRQHPKDYGLPRYLWPHYFSFEKTPQQPAPQPQREPPMPAAEWVNQEIERLTRMQQRAANPFEPEVLRQKIHKPSYVKRWPSLFDRRGYVPSYYVKEPWPVNNVVSEDPVEPLAHEMNPFISKQINKPVAEPINEEQKKKEFALTPRDEGYFEPTEKDNSPANLSLEGLHEGGGQQTLNESENQSAIDPEIEPVPPRQIRQNPNLSRTKSLVAGDLDKLRIGLGHDENGQMDNSRRTSETADTDAVETISGVILLSAVGAALVLAVLGFAIGWYTLSKRAKAAADVDYPAYGVTGPTADTSGDRKLAHSAHMYHYQHQKQQIIAMERNGMEQRSGSVSDPESEEENEEGDYTVYECPGFATTGEMEVKNPLFKEEPTPATPGKCEVVKPQPKD